MASILFAGSAHALVPSHPTLTCTDNPAIFNTGIAGNTASNASYNNSTLPMPNGTPDQHWVWGYIPQTANVPGWAWQNPSGQGNSVDDGSNPYDVGYVPPDTSTTPTTPAVNGTAYSYLNKIVWTKDGSGNESTAIVGKYAGVWMDSPFNNANWIGFDTGNGYDINAHDYNAIFYKYEFNIDSAVTDGTFNLRLNFYADDYIKQIFVNGKPLLDTNVSLASFDAARGTSIALGDNWKVGQLNTLIIQTFNATQPAGLLVQAQGAALCASPVSVVKSTTQSTAVSAGQTDVPFTITVSNYTNTTQKVNITDDLPNGIASYTWTCTSGTAGAPVLSNSAGLTACPAGTNTVPAGQSPPPQPGPLNLSQFPMSSQSTLQFNISATIAASPPPVITNKVVITPSDSALCQAAGGTNQCSDTASVSTGDFLSITKTARKPSYFGGDTVAFDVTVSNAGSTTISGIAIKDVMSGPLAQANATWTCAPPISSASDCPKVGTTIVTSGKFDSSGLLTDNSGNAVSTFSLKSQDSLVFTVSGVAPAVTSEQQEDNTASIVEPTAGAQCWSNGASSPIANCTASASTKIEPPTPIALTKSLTNSGTLYAGDAQTYTVTVVNQSTATSTTGQLTDPLPAGMTLVSASCAITPATTPPAPCSLGTDVTLPAGSTLTYTLNTTVNALAAGVTSAAITNQATWTPAVPAQAACTATPAAAGATGCVAEVSNTASIRPVPVPVLELTNNPPVRTVAPGATTVFTLVASNAANVAITEATLTTDKPADLTLGNWTCKATAPAECPDMDLTKASGPLNLTGLSLPVGGALTFTAEGTLASTLQNDDSVTLIATLSSPTPSSKCKDDAATCVRPAKVNIKTAAAVGGNVTPVPVDSIWMLAALASLMLAAAAVMQRRTQRVEKAQRK